MTDNPVRFAVIGCGAVAGAHLPILAESPHCEIALVVDKDEQRAREAAAAHGVQEIATDYRAVVGRADAAVVALPHFLHAPVSCELLRGGVHVLVEKPMALTVAECDQMIAAAEQGGATLAIGQLRRFFYSSQWIRRAVETGLLGEIRGFDMREGFVYSWPAASDFTLRKDAGGGVLADGGAHALDTLLYWLGDWESFEYRDDAEGGVEADCELRLKMRCGAEGIVELSRTRDLRNTVILRGSRATLEVESKFDSAVRLTLDGEEIVFGGRTFTDAKPEEDVNDIFRRQLTDFLGAIRERRTPAIDGHEGRKAVALIEACHEQRQPLELAWRAWA